MAKDELLTSFLILVLIRSALSAGPNVIPTSPAATVPFESNSKVVVPPTPSPIVNEIARATGTPGAVLIVPVAAKSPSTVRASVPPDIPATVHYGEETVYSIGTLPAEPTKWSTSATTA